MLFRKRNPTSDDRGDAERRCADEFLSLLQQGADVRRSKVRRLRRSIALGGYENDLKLEIAADRLADAELKADGVPGGFNDAANP